MKSLFYYTFGVVTALYAFMILWNLYSFELLDDYYIELFKSNYSHVWYYGSIGISAILILFALIWVYNLGKGANHEKRESLFKRDDEEIKPYL